LKGWHRAVERVEGGVQSRIQEEVSAIRRERRGREEAHDGLVGHVADAKTLLAKQAEVRR
jgi:hypothetical protein